MIKLYPLPDVRVPGAQTEEAEQFLAFHSHDYVPLMRMGRQLASLPDVFRSRGKGTSGRVEDPDIEWFAYVVGPTPAADPQIGGNGGETSASEHAQDVRTVFERLASDWEAETNAESSLARIFNNEKYLQIIGLGPQAVPYMLERFRLEPERWYGALRAVTRADPAAGDRSREAVVAAWDAWAATYAAGWR